MFLGIGQKRILIATLCAAVFGVMFSLIDLPESFAGEAFPVSEHFLSYQIKETKNTPKFEKFYVGLSDQFSSGEFKVKQIYRLLNPIDKNDEGINNTITHLVGYKIQVQDNRNKVKETVLVENQFGELSLDIKKAKLLLVPSTKDLNTQSKKIPLITSDHFKCYDVKVTKNTPNFKKLKADVYDPNFGEDRTLDVKKPRLFCTPVEKNHNNQVSPIVNSQNHLVCYDAKKSKGESNHQRLTVFTSNQFGPESLDTKKERELCVPSTVNYPDNDLDGFNALSDPDDNDPCNPNSQNSLCLAIENISPEHFLAYQIKETKNTPKFEKINVGLSDQFTTGDVKVRKIDRLLNPIDKNDEGISNEITHLVGYQIKAQDKKKGAEKILVANQFGLINLDVKREKLLLLPSTKSHDFSPAAPQFNNDDHFKCYDVKVTKNTPQFKKLKADVYDPNFDEDRTFDVKKPKMFCAPVVKTHHNYIGQIQNPGDNLLCYDVKKSKSEPNHKKLTVYTNNQFGPEALDTKKERELCVPSIIVVDEPAVCGDGIVTPPEQCDDGNTDGGDGCSAICEIEDQTGPVCGDSIITPPEICDDGGTNGTIPGGCNDTCTGFVPTGPINLPPMITSDGGGDTASKSIAENTTLVTDMQTSDDLDSEGSGLTYSFTTVGGGGEDNAQFFITSTTGVLSFSGCCIPDFENPADFDGNNMYEVQVTVTDSGPGGSLTDTQDITVTVTDVAEGPINLPPMITSDGGGAIVAINVDENTFAITDIQATDDSDSEGSGLTYSFTTGSGEDNIFADLDPIGGILTFTARPDFETMVDNNGDGVYDLAVKVTDSGGLSDTQNLLVTVDNVLIEAFYILSLNLLSIHGDAGDDTITVSKTPAGDEYQVNGSTIPIHDGPATVADTLGIEISGLEGNDIICADETNGTILPRQALFGDGGEDLLCGSDGEDELLGGLGNDTLRGRNGHDLLVGGSGDDDLFGNNGEDRLVGEVGNDELFGGGDNDLLFGNEDDDILRGDGGDDLLDGGLDTDDCDGGTGLDTEIDCEF